MKRFAVVTVAVVWLAGCGPVGDPGPPVALRGSGSDRLGAVVLLLCPHERVRSLEVSQDIGRGGEIKRGQLLWRIEASPPSPMSEFIPGNEPDGFRTVVPPSPAITGMIDVSYTTTAAKGEAGLRIRSLPPDIIWFQGRQLTQSKFLAKAKDRCATA